MATHHLGLFAGAGVLVVLAAVYPVVADELARPLAVFALPPLMTAVLAGWRPTLVVGLASVGVASVFGVAGPLDAAALAARLTIIVVAVAAGVAGAWFRERQAGRIDDLGQETAILRDFQRGLAPVAEASPGLQVAVRYVASERHLEIGGDFVDAVGLGDGRLAVVVGDVCGHGPTEAAFGTAVRAAWRTLVLTQDADPVAWVQLLEDTFVRGGHDERYVTLCTGVIEPRQGRATLVSAGHPWPIVIASTIETPPMLTGAPLGLGPSGWRATTLDISGRFLVLYSDGLIENPLLREPTQRWGEDGLVAWLQQQRPPRDPDDLAERLMAAALAERHARDDVAVLVVRCEPRDLRDGHEPARTARQLSDDAGRPSLPKGRGSSRRDPRPSHRVSRRHLQPPRRARR